MDDRMLTELLDTDSGLLVSLHIRSMDQNEAIKTGKRKITDIDSMKIDAQKKAVREGFDMDIIPTDLATYAEMCIRDRHSTAHSVSLALAQQDSRQSNPISHRKLRSQQNAC